jgi:hypothetical protein
MRQALGEETALFRQVNEEITNQQQALGDNQGFRKAREDFQRLMDDRAEKFREQQYQEQITFQQTEEAKRREIQHTRQDQDDARRHSREDAQTALGLLRDQQDVARQRSREDAEATRQLNKEIAQATARGATPQEVAQIRTNAAEQQDDRTRQRRFQDEDRAIARARQQEDLGIRRAQEAQDRQLARTREQEDIRNQRESQARQHGFELQQQRASRDEQLKVAAQVREFEDQQSDLRLGHQVRNIDAEAEKRIASANATFKTLQQREQLHRDQVEEQVNRPAWRRMLQSFITEFADPADERVAELVRNALAQANVDVGDIPTGRQESIGAIQEARRAGFGFAAATGTPPPNDRPIPVQLPPAQIDDIANAVGNLPPLEMDGEEVESIQSKIRRNKNLARTLG